MEKYNKSQKLVKDTFGISYEDVRNVYNALYGYENYNGNETEYEDGMQTWWENILSNARRKNASPNDKLLKPRRFRKSKY